MAKTKGNKKYMKRKLSPAKSIDTMLELSERKTQKSRIKRVSWRDEQIEGMSVSDVPTEFADPAILAVREITKVCYTKEELINLRDVPLSKKKPEFMESTETSFPWALGSERWPFDRKRSVSGEPSDSNSGSGGNDHRRRNGGDPRERIRKENDGIVLSPQRRSFNSGCFVPASRGETLTRNNRPHSPLGSKNENSHLGIREIQPSNRRIGSGRILRSNGDFNDKSESEGGDGYGGSSGGYRGSRGTNNDDDKYDRRSFGRDFDMRDRDSNKDNRRNGRGFDRRKVSDREPEEPEWFSGGPVSQHDTIELRGFEESDRPGGKKKQSLSQMKRAKEWSKKKEQTMQQQNATQDKEDDDKSSNKSSTTTSESKVVVEISEPAKSDNDVPEQKEEGRKPAQPDADGKNKASSILTDQSLNFDDILKCDTIPGLLSNIEIENDGNNSKSRFSRWFKQESPEKQGSRRSSLHDESIIKNLLNDIGESNTISNSIPGDSEAYFAPISPAGNNLGGVIGTGKREAGQAQTKRPINLMEMLQVNNHPAANMQNVKQQPMVGKILSLDELEAKIRKNADAVGVPQKPQSKPDEEMSAAFKKLLAQAQASGAHSNIPNMNKTQPMSLLEMLKDSQQQDEAARLSAAARLMGPASPNLLHHPHNPLQTHIQTEIALQLQQAQIKQQQQQKQMEMFNKLINASTSMNAHQMRASPSLHDIGLQQQTRELLNRPEAQAILQAMHQRIPSPRELQVHTQNILQRALIKKKLEEQQENYRKKQEMAFTPTSVLRKMTADKDESKENKAVGDKMQPGRPLTGVRPQPTQTQGNQQWYGKQAGRPIVKANNYQTQTPEQFFSQHQQHQQQQQRIFNQLQQQQQLASQQQQQRKPPGAGQFGGTVNNPPTSSVGSHQFNQSSSQYPLSNQQFGQQLTQQQLRAQHQHRPNSNTSTTTGNTANVATSQPQSQNPQQQNQQMQSYQQQQQSGAAGMWQQLLNNGQPQQRVNRNTTGRTDNDVSPTRNHLAQWFSPDLLERARGGELPSTAGLAQHVISLEEIERQTAPPIHN